jgi:hypothetical protein
MADLTDKQRMDAANLRYQEAMHAVQSGILATLAKQFGLPLPMMKQADIAAEMGECSPKHLRTGISSCMVNAKALADLLLAKGVFSEVEYVEALATAAVEERKLYERSLGVSLG